MENQELDLGPNWRKCLGVLWRKTFENFCQIWTEVKIKNIGIRPIDDGAATTHGRVAQLQRSETVSLF
jgi:hypothetical protein